MFYVTVKLHKMPLAAQCQTHSELIQQWEESSHRFSSAVRLLSRKMAILSKEEFHILHAETEDARLASENARLAIDLHCLEHRCDASQLRR